MTDLRPLNENPLNDNTLSENPPSENASGENASGENASGSPARGENARSEHRSTGQGSGEHGPGEYGPGEYGRGELRVHDLGRADGPTLVLLHGMSDSGLCWPDAVRRWGHDHRIVAPDARGHGESPRFDSATGGSNRFDGMVTDLVCLLEALAAEGGEAPILVAHSMGAGVAATVLATRPDLVRAGVLEDPPWFSGPRNDAPDTIQEWARGFRDNCEASVAAGKIERPLWPDCEFLPWAVAKTQFDLSLTHREQIARPEPWIEVAAAVAQPTLVVTGGREEAVLVGSRSRQRLAELANGNIEVAVVPGAGHTVRRDSADAYHQIVDPWIRRHFATGS